MATNVLITCKPGYEKTLTREMELFHLHLHTKGRGWILAQWDDSSSPRQHDTSLIDPCFAYHILENPVLIHASSVNALADELLNLFITHIGQTPITEPWARLFSASDTDQCIQRARIVEKCWHTKALKRISRVTKLSKEGIPPSTKFSEGFFVHFIDFHQVFVAFKARSAGQQRMHMDPLAPSRSYLKIEEAFHLFGEEPHANETVIDLGAAPGGWSYSALKRGAFVTAIDNGPLKGAVASHPNIEHLTIDALTYIYDQSQPADWLLCDILEKPDVIFDLLRRWLNKKWCRYFVANMKVGREDPIALLKKIRDPKNGLLPYCKRLSIRQLYHDREEITVMGQAK